MGKKNKLIQDSTLNLNVWTSNIPQVIADEIIKYSPQRINIFAAEEHEIAGTWSADFDILKKLFIDKNIEVHFIFGSADMEFYLTRYHFPEYKIYTHLWPSYYLSFTLSSMKHNKFIQTNDFKKLGYKYPFISMNNRPHGHRCVFMDYMAKNKLIDKGAVTWHNDDTSYVWKFWDNPRRMALTDDFVTKGNSYGLPDEWSCSFMNLVSECTENRIYFSEKTWIPLICHKPFLVQSAKHFYKKFVEMGFEIYDEIFDYSFDECDDVEIRTNLLMQNVKNILDKDYNEMYRSILPKIKHNFNRAIEIAVDNEYMPQIAKDNEFVENTYTALKDINGYRNELLSLSHSITHDTNY